MSAPLCDQIELMLPDYLAGALPEADRARVEAHLAGCAACREMADTLRLLHGAMHMTPLPEALEQPRRAAIHDALRRRIRPTFAQRWAALLEWLNPARAPAPSATVRPSGPPDAKPRPTASSRDSGFRPAHATIAPWPPPSSASFAPAPISAGSSAKP